MIDEGFSEFEVDLEHCIICCVDDKACGYQPYSWCEHAVCEDCVREPDVSVSGALEYMCAECFVNTDPSEFNIDKECPLCALDYSASGVSEQDHWLITHEYSEFVDEGVRDVSSLK